MFLLHKTAVAAGCLTCAGPGRSIGRPKHHKVMQGAIGDFVVGPQVDEYRGILKISYPMEHGCPPHLTTPPPSPPHTHTTHPHTGLTPHWRFCHSQVNNWEDMEKIWMHLYKNELKVPAAEVPPSIPPPPSLAHGAPFSVSPAAFCSRLRCPPVSALSPLSSCAL